MATKTFDEKTNFTFKIDKTTRDQFDSLCNSIGISMSSALNAFIKQAIRDQKMTFSLVDENGFTAEEVKILLERLEDYKNNKFVQHDLIED